MPKLIVAGFNGKQIPSFLHALFEDDTCVVGCSKSHFQTVTEQFPRFNHERWIPIVPLQHCFDAVANVAEGQAVLFLLSGDPLFFGLGKRLKQQFPGKEIHFIPAISYMQSCFANAGINWDDADFLSLHGRELKTIDRQLNSKKLFIYTDPENSPDVIAAYLRAKFGDASDTYIVHVGERIGSGNQRFISGSLDKVSSMSFSQPNSMILLDTHDQKKKSRLRFGLSESDIEHSRGLITKSEVRAAVIHRLQFPDTGVFWDIGAGSGSISIESARLYPSLSVYAIEKNDEQLTNIRTNKTMYGCRNLHIIDGQAPERLVDLPNPDRIFIGGSGGRLEDIIKAIAGRLTGRIHIVASAVLDSTAKKAPELLHALGFDVDVSIVETSRYHYPSKVKNRFNPIHIICGTRS